MIGLVLWAVLQLDAPLGRTPVLDGVISPGEYADATPISGVRGWMSQFSPVTRADDLSLQGWVKHDGKRLYFAFHVQDDVLYGIDIPRWLPDNSPKAHERSREGWPWFGDEMEILINSRNTWKGNENAAGDGSSWQMVCNLTRGGIQEGEPRRDPKAWATYEQWIRTGAQQCVAKAGKKSYVLEWSIAFDPCIEVEPGVFWSPALGDRTVGLNLALGDLDEKEKGAGNFGNFHHEEWWAGAKDVRTQLRHFGQLRLRARQALGRSQTR
jgi:solute:Na+ symporter, SSS family